MTDEPLAQLTLVIDAGLDADDEELNDLRLRLRQEINELEVEAERVDISGDSSADESEAR